jgi:hypothetical protein
MYSSGLKTGTNMQTNLSHRSFYRFAFPALIGVALFFWFAGGMILSPTNIGWIINRPGDPIQHYVGWQAFRHAPMFQWPFGLDKNYGESLGASIVFSDSLPLFAFPFKLIRSSLPTDFQYMGLWILLCFVLQAFFAWKLISKFTSDLRIIALATGLLTLSPAMLWRLYGHESLIGHWIILAALNIYFSAQRKWLKWTVLLCLATLVHAYLFVMAAAIWAFDIIRSVWYERSGRAAQIGTAVGTLVCVAFCMWFAGYFMGGSVAGDGFGVFRTNLISLINPHDVWSRVRTGSVHGGDYEGFAYLGLGNIALIVFAVCAAIASPISARVDKRMALPLAILAVLFFVYALSNHVIVGSRELFQYPLPRFVHRFTDTFRCSGRFIWPVIYMLEGAAVFLVVRLLTPARAVCVLAACLVVQIVDISKAPEVFKILWTAPAQESLSSSFWNTAPAQYRRVAVVPPTGKSIFPIALWALKNGMSINEVDRARLGGADLEAAQAQVLDEIEQRRFRPDTIYIFRDKPYLSFAAANVSARDFVGVVDGYNVLATGYRGCAPSCVAGPETTSALMNPAATTSFAAAGDSEKITLYGWGDKEQTARWTNGHRASLSLHVGKLNAPIKVRFLMNAFVPAGQKPQNVSVSVGGRHAVDWVVGADPTIEEVTIEPRDLAATNGYAEITFKLPNAVSPAELGLSIDGRELGVSVQTMSIIQ